MHARLRDADRFALGLGEAQRFVEGDLPPLLRERRRRQRHRQAQDAQESAFHGKPR
ncbi:hypothetical protein D3C83_280970 [compost metagenome]